VKLVDLEGPRGGRGVLVLGGPDSDGRWAPIGPLAEQYRVHVMAAASAELAESYAGAALDDLDDVAGSRVHVVGRDAGAAAALWLAANEPQRVARLAIVGPVQVPGDVDLGAIAAQTMLIAGSEAADSTKALMAELANVRLEVLPGPDVTHGQAGQVSALLLEHFRAGATAEAGYASRRVALGDEHVDRTVGSISEFAAPFQDFLTRYCWGEVWTRPGLSRRDRSLATIAGLIVLGAEHEILLHVRAGLRHGLTLIEIRELLQHMALYAGLPRAFSALQALDRQLASDPSLRELAGLTA
jgi:alkylhydroperoxidase/carboxymuconolactone decarboxylase family protein YurZ